jgi:hypothetical protein
LALTRVKKCDGSEKKVVSLALTRVKKCLDKMEARRR